MRPIMIDGGACTGEILKDYLDSHEVFAFEPNPYNFKHLREQYGSTPSVHLFPYALGYDNNEVLLYDPEKRVGVNSSTIIKVSARANGVLGKFVRQITLSDFLFEFQIEKVDILKLDIEGAEYAVLADLMESAYINKIDTIYVEFHAIQLIPALQATHDKVYADLIEQYQGILHVWDWPAHKYAQVKP